MPLLSRCFLRGGFICLAVGMVIGGLILIQKGTGRFPGFWALLPGHIYLVFIGGMSQCALGVCYWIFPRLGGAQRRGNTRLAWLSYVALNASIILISCHLLVHLLLGPVAASLTFTAAGMLQAMAALAFVCHIWPRIRPSGATAPDRQ